MAPVQLNLESRGVQARSGGSTTAPLKPLTSTNRRNRWAGLETVATRSRELRQHIRTGQRSGGETLGWSRPEELCIIDERSCRHHSLSGAICSDWRRRRIPDRDNWKRDQLEV
jgi:hypothetical protein